jgi:drug/metabolite transporter (DMT)-like permease
MVCAVLSLFTAVLTEEIKLSGIRNAAIPILYGGIMSVGVGYTLQVIGQKKAIPSHAAIILSLESLFAVAGGWIILNEGLTLRGIFGCFLMLSGIIITQIKNNVQS